jgi:hypothetical protein
MSQSTSTPSTSILSKEYVFTAFEIVNPDICDKLAHMAFRDFLTFWDPEEVNEEGEKETVQAQYNLITSYCQQQKTSNYSLERNYKHSKSNPQKGRIFVDDLGIQRIYKQFRGCLCEGLYYDLDMINAHPTILLHICRNNGIPAASLSEYVANREHYIQQLMTDDNLTRDIAKQLFLVVLNRSYDTTKINGKKIKNKFFLKFDKDIRVIQNTLIQKYPVEAKKVLENNFKAHDNHAGCLINLLMTNLENEILQMTITFLRNMNIIPDVPMFDGIMIRASSVNISIEELIARLDTLTYAFDVKWSHKPHNTELKSRILSLEKSDKLSYVGTNIVNIGKYAWDAFLNTRMVSCNGNLYFKSLTDNLYINNLTTIRAVIHNYITRQDFYICGEEETVEPLNRKFKNVKDVVEQILLIANDTTYSDNYFMDTLFEKSELKLNFDNGVFDFKEMKFINDPTAIEGFFKIKYDYTDTRNTELIAEIYERVINPIFGITNETDLEKISIKSQLRDCILYRLARAIAGFYEDKNWFMLEGLRNSGKGVLYRLLETSICNYLKTCDSNNFLFKGLGQGNDSAKENMFLYNMQFNRIIYIQEFKIPPNGKTFINGSLIKSICSGGDRIETRAHHDMPITFKCQASLIFGANEYPEISPRNALETCTILHMPSKFIDKDKGEKEELGFMNYPCDPTLKQFIKRDEVGLAFIHILINALNFTSSQIKYPSEIRNENIIANDQLDTNADSNIIQSIFKFTGSANDTVSNSEITATLLSKNIVIGKMLLAKQLKILGAIPHKFPNGTRGYSSIAIL